MPQQGPLVRDGSGDGHAIDVQLRAAKKSNGPVVTFSPLSSMREEYSECSRAMGVIVPIPDHGFQQARVYLGQGVFVQRFPRQGGNNVAHLAACHICP